MFFNRKTDSDDLQIPELPGQNLLVMVSLDGITFQGPAPEQFISADLDGAVSVEDWA